MSVIRDSDDHYYGDKRKIKNPAKPSPFPKEHPMHKIKIEKCTLGGMRYRDKHPGLTQLTN
jgi:hypothetical protein